MNGGNMWQYGWLNSAFGFWHFTAENNTDLGRFWENRELALSELETEGWFFVGKFPQRYKH
jgi:hypothetical protein